MGVDDGMRRVGADPFDGLNDIDEVRRFRGRLAAPVTVWTATDAGGNPTGITVSSLVVAEGEPASLLGLIGPVSEFWDAATVSRRCVVHVLEAASVRMADQFALRYPGDPFEGLTVTQSEWGPVLAAAPTRARCSVAGFLEAGYQLLVRARIDGIELPDEDSDPLVHYRGRYLTTAPRPRRDIPEP